jgi:hypothetical protein
VSKFRIDLGVVHPDAPGRFLAGVECDGATYHSSPSARDRDRVRHVILETLGWRLVRTWSTDWFRDPEGCLEQVHARLEALVEEDRRQQAEAGREAESVASEVGEAAPDEDGEPAGAEVIPFEQPRAAEEAEVAGSPAVPDGTPERLEPLVARAPDMGMGRRDPAAFHDPAYRDVLRDMAQAIIAAEGPVTVKRVSDLIAREHGFLRTGKAISATVWTAVGNLQPRTRSADGHEILWPGEMEPQPLLPFRGLAVAGRTRDWDEVPLPERLGLLQEVARTEPPDLARAVATAIGYKRLTESFRSEIADLLGQLERLGQPAA